MIVLYQGKPVRIDVTRYLRKLAVSLQRCQYQDTVAIQPHPTKRDSFMLEVVQKGHLVHHIIDRNGLTVEYYTRCRGGLGKLPSISLRKTSHRSIDRDTLIYSKAAYMEEIREEIAHWLHHGECSETLIAA